MVNGFPVAARSFVRVRLSPRPFPRESSLVHHLRLANPSACPARLAVLAVIEDEGLVANLPAEVGARAYLRRGPCLTSPDGIPVIAQATSGAKVSCPGLSN